MGHHAMIFENIKWPENERDPERVESMGLARYVCPKCRTEWDDDDRNLAVRDGLWQDPETGLMIFDYLDEYRPKKIGFRIPAWLSYFVCLSECAGRFSREPKTKPSSRIF